MSFNQIASVLSERISNGPSASLPCGAYYQLSQSNPYFIDINRDGVVDLFHQHFENGCNFIDNGDSITIGATTIPAGGAYRCTDILADRHLAICRSARSSKEFIISNKDVTWHADPSDQGAKVGQQITIGGQRVWLEGVWLYDELSRDDDHIQFRVNICTPSSRENIIPLDALSELNGETVNLAQETYALAAKEPVENPTPDAEFLADLFFTFESRHHNRLEQLRWHAENSQPADDTVLIGAWVFMASDYNEMMQKIYHDRPSVGQYEIRPECKNAVVGYLQNNYGIDRGRISHLLRSIQPNS